MRRPMSRMLVCQFIQCNVLSVHVTYPFPSPRRNSTSRCFFSHNFLRGFLPFLYQCGRFKALTYMRSIHHLPYTGFHLRNVHILPSPRVKEYGVRQRYSSHVVKVCAKGTIHTNVQFTTLNNTYLRTPTRGHSGGSVSYFRIFAC